MTLRDLISHSFCEAFQVVIRENGHGKWLYSYKIGKNVSVGKYDYYLHPNGDWLQSYKFFVPESPIEVGKHDHSCKTLIIPDDIKKLPKHVYDLDVAYFRYGIVVEDSIQHDYDCLAIDCFPNYLKPLPNDIKNELSKGDQLVFDFS